MPRRPRCFSPLLLLLLLAGACPSPAGLSTYPRRDIDRPYTLPEDVNSVMFVGRVSHAPGFTYPTEDPEGPAVVTVPAETDGTPPLPIGYEVSLTERLTLEGFILPLGLRYQAYRSPEHLVGVFARATEISYSSFAGLTVGAQTGVFHRYVLGRQWALESTALAGATWREDQAGDSVVGAETGPRFQGLPGAENVPLSVRPWVGAYGGTDYGRRKLLVPVGVDMRWNLHPRWSLGLAYRYRGIGYFRDRHDILSVSRWYW